MSLGDSDPNHNNKPPPHREVEKSKKIAGC
jgi:hypothetical protein